MANNEFSVSTSGNTITLSNGVLEPNGGNIKISGTTISDLTNGDFTQIQVQEIDGIEYKYQFLVVGGKIDVVFKATDESDDTYTLNVLSPIVENHYVDYNSDSPSINEIVITGDF